jgi:hypothetical protein
MSDFGEYDAFSEINAVGNPNKVMPTSNTSESHGYGPIGNCRPAMIVANGLSIDTGTLFANKALRKDMSTTRNESLKRSLSSRK